MCCGGKRGLTICADDLGICGAKVTIKTSENIPLGSILGLLFWGLDMMLSLNG